MKCCYSLMVLAALVSWGWGHSLCGDAEQCRGAGLAEDKMAQMFRDFMKTYNKTYKDQKEEKRRFKIFVENAEKVRLLQESEEGTARYGVTKFSDISADEFTHGSLKPVAKESCEKVSFSNPLNNLSEAMDWRKLHAVTPVKDQQQCKCCWAFAVVGNVESQWFIKKQKLISLAEQELLDCGAQTNNCSGVRSTWLSRTSRNSVWSRRDSYPYKGQQSSVIVIMKSPWLRLKSVSGSPAMKEF
ncbi:cathepsin F-like isoform X2 [Pristis pectinata]|uniref:cathepsin F-like isoform X2 n=1 Tax=Pristis pectinata TaxID=685728 RepID=UPI00223DF62B|nr:cathepsin F-like isoform X2 [Pristis pectinata]